MKKSSLLCALATLILGCSQALAVTAEISTPADATTDITCRSAGVFSTKLLTHVCWDCMFPIKMSGIVIAGGKNEDRVPEESWDTIGLCMCFDNLGMPKPGVPSAFWEPYRLAEYVSTPGCSQVLLGMRFPFDRMMIGGGNSHYAAGTKRREAFYHYHYYSFPVMDMLSMYIPEMCNPGFYNDLDAIYLSEIDPSWSRDEVAYFTNPENALLSTPLAPLACIPDAFATFVDTQLQKLWWCAGTWGDILPTSGNVGTRETTLDHTSLLKVRSMYQMHRRGIEYGTVGEDNACGGSITPYLPKEQYRFSLFYPVAEADDNHILGAPTLMWGPFKLIPGLGEDPVYIIWRWVDCCAT